MAGFALVFQTCAEKIPKSFVKSSRELLRLSQGFMRQTEKTERKGYKQRKK